MESKTKPVMSKLRLLFFKRWKGQRVSSSDATDISADAFILFDKNLDIVGMNPLSRSLFHLILGENVISEDILNGAPNVKPDNKNNGRCEKYLNAIRKGKLFFVDSIVIHSGFLDIHLKVEAFKVGKGFGIIFSDIDALKKSDEAQYESHGASATDFKSAADCIFIFDLKGTILHGSRAGEKLTGYPWEEIKGKSLLELALFAPEYLPKAARLLELSAAGKSTGPDEFELIRKDGSHVFAFKRPGPGGQFIQNDCQREEIGAAIDRLTQYLFRGHIGWRAKDLSDLCLLGHGWVFKMGDTKVRDLDLTIGLEDDVAGFDISVDDPLLMSVVKSFGHLDPQIHDLLQAKSFLLHDLI